MDTDIHHQKVRAQYFLSAALDQSRFNNRRGQSSIVLGNTLYVDAGDTAVLDQNNTANNYPFNLTYTIDLSKSWTNSTVVFNSFNKPGSAFFAANLWTDSSKSILLSYNGELSRADPAIDKTDPPPSELWQLDRSTNIWSRYSASRFDRVGWAGGTCGGGLCVAIGGRETWRTSTDFYNNVSVQVVTNNLVIYNTTSQTWSNSSIANLSPTNTVYQSNVVHIPGFNGATGLFISLGGAYSKSVSILQDVQLIPFDKVTLYEPNTNTWATQTTSGSIPIGRVGACAVGVAGDNGTYEIFVYGGSRTGWATVDAEDAADIQRAQIYILSIPSFTWTKSPVVPTNSRAMLSCNVVGAGNRQMLAIGGVPVRTTSTLSKDPWPNALNIFDMTDLKWMDKYEPNPPVGYLTPQLVKSTIEKNGKFAQKWDSDVVQGWFTNSKAASDGSGSNSSSLSSGTNNNSNNSGSNGNTNSNNANGASSSRTGIVAGSVAGGVVLFGAIIFGVWFIRRQKRQQRSILSSSAQTAQWYPSEYPYRPELDAGIVFPGTPESRAWHKKLSKGRPPYEKEAAGAQLHEKDSLVQRVEMPVSDDDRLR